MNERARIIRLQWFWINGLSKCTFQRSDNISHFDLDDVSGIITAKEYGNPRTL